VKTYCILVFSGPSGGHLFPAQAFAEAAHQSSPDIRIVLVTSIRAHGLCSKFPSSIFSEIVYLPEFGSPIGLSLSGIRGLLSIPRAIWQSWQLLGRLKPQLVVGFGSFVSYFGVLFAVRRGIPTIIHEQNQIPGKATRMLQNNVNQIAVSFPQTDFQKTPSGSVIVSGLPIRKDIREGVVTMDQKKAQPFTILICGGSQGSAFLNSAVLDAFSHISAEERSQFAVIHIAGMGHESQVSRRYQELAVCAEVYPFFEQMQLVYNRSHMAISRAGANSAFEQALYGIPTVFIPYPHAEGHQNNNALFFVKAGGALMQRQNDQASEWIAGVLRDWVRKPESYWTASRKMRELACENGHEQLWALAQKVLNK